MMVVIVISFECHILRINHSSGAFAKVLQILSFGTNVVAVFVLYPSLSMDTENRMLSIHFSPPLSLSPNRDSATLLHQ